MLMVSTDVAQDIVTVGDKAFELVSAGKLVKSAVKMLGKDVVKGGGKKVAFDEHLSFKTPNGHSNSNFMYGVNRNVMPVKGTGTFGGLEYTGLNQVKQPTVQSLANDYGSAIKPKVNNELTHRIGGSKIGDQPKMVEKKVVWKPVTSNGQDAIKQSVISDHKLNKALGRVDAKVGKGLGVDVLRQQTLGKAIREDAIPLGSKLEYLGPGRVKFDGVEFRAVRDLGHLSEDHLWKMYRKGINPVDSKGIRLDGHHYKQQYHRELDAFMVEIPDPNHCISNAIQHPLGKSGGLSVTERADWKKLRPKLNMERGRIELIQRGLLK